MILLTIVEIVVVVVVAYYLVLFFGDKTKAIGDSMSPTILDGQTLLLDKFSYRVREPRAGDVVAFQPGGRNGASISIKRIIGIPGDTVLIDGGKVFINGELFEEPSSRPVMADPGLAKTELTLESDMYFVLGDNRNHSTDSRYVSVGNIKGDYIFGRVWFNVGVDNFGFVE